jgi:hypothetical protein
MTALTITAAIGVEAASIRLPDFLIIGEMRCGTTTLWEMLSAHAQIFFPAEKEVHFFDGRHGRWNRGVDAYAAMFAAAAPGQLCGEATPDYLFHDDACDRIRDVLPGARLVAILRDPAARAWSHYWHNVRRGRETLSFEQALGAEPQRLASGDADRRSHCSYVARGHYLRQLSRYERAFGRDALCVTFLEDLKRAPQAELARVCRHLSLCDVGDVGGDDEAGIVPERNRAKYPRWPRFNAAAGRAKRWVERRLPVLAVPARWAAAATRPLRVYSGEARMPVAIRDRLHDEFRDSDAALAGWLGRPVPWRRS